MRIHVGIAVIVTLLAGSAGCSRRTVAPELSAGVSPAVARPTEAQGRGLAEPDRPADGSATQSPGRPEMVLQSGHSLELLSAAFSPDGDKVLTGSMDGTAILWDRATGQQLRTYRAGTSTSEDPGFIKHVAFTADGTRILACLRKRTMVWDVATGQLVTTVPEEVIGTSPDGRLVYCFTDDTKPVVVKEVETGRVRATLPSQAFAFSPDGRRALVAGNHENTIKILDTQSGRELATAGAVAGGYRAVFSPDGKSFLLFGGSAFNTIAGAAQPNRGEVRLHDAGTGRQLYSFDPPPTGPTFFFGAAFSPDGRRLAIAGKVVDVWDIETRRKLCTLTGHTHEINAVCFSPDGRALLTASFDRTAALWDVATGRRLRTYQGNTGIIWSLNLNARGRRLLAQTGYDTAVLWDLPTGKVLGTYHQPPHRLVSEAGSTSVALSPDGEQVVTALQNGTAVLWQVQSGRAGWTFRHPQGEAINSVAFSPDGRHVLLGCGHLFARVTGLATAGIASTTSAAAEQPEGRAILLDTETGKPVRTFGDPGKRATLALLNPDGSRVLLVRSDSAGSGVWEVATGRRLFDLPDGLITAAFTPDGRALVALVASKATPPPGKVATQVYEAANGKLLRTLDGQGLFPTALAVSPDGKRLFWGSVFTDSALADADSGKILRKFPVRVGMGDSVRFSPDGRQIITGGLDGSIRFWDAATGEERACLVSVEDGRGWAALTPEGLFDGSRLGREKVSYRIGSGLTVVPLDRFFQDFYYPGLFAAVWRGERPLPEKPFQPSPAPSLKILVNREPGGTSNRVAVAVAVTDRGRGVKGPWLRHNGAALRAGQLLKKDGPTLHYRFDVALVSGANLLEVRAATADGAVESEPAVASLPFDGQLPEPDLYVLAIGVNRFAPDAGIANLDFCVPDAQAIAHLFRTRAGKFYRQTHVTILSDEQATRANILRAIDDLSAKAQPQDTLVLYVASHGYTVGQRFYLFPHDFRLTNEPVVARSGDRATTGVVGLRGYRARDDQEAAVRRHGLAIDELGEVLAKVPALKRVLIFDTCHSGSAIQLAGKPQNPFAFGGAIERFSRAQGVYCLSATAADELANEPAELGHGILTYALLAGAGAADRGPLKGQAMRARDGAAVDVLEWFRYARSQVPGLYARYANREHHVELSGEDQPGFPLLTLPPP